MAKSKSSNSLRPILRLSEREREAYFEVARQATHEVHQLASFLRASVVKGAVGSDGDLAVRGICTRLMMLSDIVFESILADDQLADLGQLSCRLGVEAA